MPVAAKVPLRGVVFDMDGTLTVPNLDFEDMYRQAGVPRGEDILSAKWREDSTASRVVEQVEEQGRRTLKLMPGAQHLAQWLHAHGIPVALVTRNSRITVEYFHQHHWKAPVFEPAISRDDDFPAKPDPGALAAIAEHWGVQLGPELLMVGDSPSNDIAFGHAAGTSTALLDIGQRHQDAGTTHDPDICVSQLSDLAATIWGHFAVDSPICAPALHAKCPAPEPMSEASRAAVSGNATALAAMAASELAAVEEASGNNPLIWAADAGHLDATEVLIRSGCPLDVCGYLGATAVSRAARRGHAAVVDLLLSHGADPELPNNKLQYPMHFAAFKLQPQALEVLLKHKASPFVLDRKGRTPAEDTSDEAIRATIMQVQQQEHMQALEGSKL